MMQNSILEFLPDQIIQHIFTFLPLHDLTCLLLTCSDLHTLVENYIYSSILIAPQAKISKSGKSYDIVAGENEISKFGPQIIGGSTVLLGIANSHKLLRSLRENPRLLGKVQRLSFPCYYESAEIRELQKEFQVLLVSSNLFSHENGVYTLSLEFENHHDGESKGGLKLIRKRRSGNIDQKKPTDRLKFRNSPLDHGNLHPADLVSLQDISLRQNGFQFLQNIPNPAKLMPRSLSISHEHSEKLEIPGTSSTINFRILHSKIDISQLSNLTLDLNCTHQCLCIPNFFQDFESYLDTNQRDISNLSKFKLILHHEDWLDATEFLESVITPITGVIAKMRNLHSLSLSLSVDTFKLYTQDGMSPSRLNIVNSGILKVVMQAVEKSSIKELAFPDLFTLFCYYKPQFYQSVLHTCQCSGCKKLLAEIKRRYLPIDDEDVADDESGFYVVIGFVLDKLRRERRLVLCGKGQHVLHTGTPGILESSFGKDSSVEFGSGEETGRFLERACEGVSDSDCDSDCDAETHIEPSMELPIEMENEIDFSDEWQSDDQSDLGSSSVSDFSETFSIFSEYLAMSNSTLHSDYREKPKHQSDSNSTNPKNLGLDPEPHGIPAKNAKNSEPADRFPPSEDLFDEMVTTYILHQTRPVVAYVSGMLPELEKLNLHGIYFQKGNGGFFSVFDKEKFPDFIFEKDLTLAPGLDPQPETTYGAWTFT